jgi:hypothetical protein
MATETLPKKEGYIPCKPKPNPIPEQVLEPTIVPNTQPIPA